MTEIKYDEYHLIYNFKLGDDLITYDKLVEWNVNTNIFDLYEYAIHWVKKYGYKYGKCLFVDICKGENLINTLYWALDIER